MTDSTALGKLRTTHTVTAIASISGVFSVTNSEAIRIGSSFSTAGDGSENGLYVVVGLKNYTWQGVMYDISLNW